MRRIAAAFAAVCGLGLSLAPPPADAATLVVSRVDDPVPNGCAPGDCSLREAVIAGNAAAGDDLIQLGPGNFELQQPGAGEDAAATGDLDINDPLSSESVVTIQGAGSGAGGSTIDGNDLDRVFDVFGAERLDLLDLRVTDGSGDGGAVRTDAGEVLMERVRLESNQAPAVGGAVWILNSFRARVVMVDCVLAGNSAASAGGAILNEGSGRLLAIGTQFTGNSAVTGGAVRNEGDAIATLVSSTLSGNTASNRGGAIFNQNEATMTLQQSSVSDNTALSDGGGIFHQNSAFLAIDRSTVSGNRALGAIAEGGGIFTQNSSQMHVTSSAISSNEAGEGGGGIRANNDPLIHIFDSTIAGNRALGVAGNFGGGGLYGSSTSNWRIERSTISGNQATARGGGIAAVDRSRFALVNSTISSNTAGTQGGGFYGEEEPRNRIESSTVAFNTAADGGGIYNATVGAVEPFAVRDSIIAGNSASGGASNCAGGVLSSHGNNLDSSTQCGLGAGGDIQNGNAALGPLANNAGPTLTHALLAGSQAIDAAGALCPATDQRGTGRPQGSRCDIGSFEVPRVAQGPAPGPAPGPAAGSKGAVATIAGRTVKVSKAGVVAITLRCPGPGTCRGTLELRTATSVEVSRRRIVKLGSKRFSISPGKSAKVRIKLAKRNLRLLRRLGRLRIKATVKPQNAAPGAKATTRTMTLSAP